MVVLYEYTLTSLALEVFDPTAPEWTGAEVRDFVEWHHESFANRFAKVRLLKCLKAFAIFTEHVSGPTKSKIVTTQTLSAGKVQFKGSQGGIHVRAVLLKSLARLPKWMNLVTRGARQCLAEDGPLVVAHFQVQDLQRCVSALILEA